MSSDDPPIWFRNSSAAIHPSQDPLHHAFHGREINDHATAAGISEVKADIPSLGINTTGGESDNEFLERHLNSCILASSIKSIVEKEDIKVNIFPNPTDNLLYIETDIINPSFEVYNIMGELVLSGQGNKVALDKLMSKGVYVIKIGTRVLTFTKQ